MYQVKLSDIAGFDVLGTRLPSGKIRLGFDGQGDVLDDFPEEIELVGTTYTLEYIKKNREECNLIDPNHPGYNIEWGVYV